MNECCFYVNNKLLYLYYNILKCTGGYKYLVVTNQNETF